MSKTEYKLTNITKWPGVLKGKHKHGFIIAIGRKNLHVGKSLVVPELTEAIEGMQAKKWLKVESITDRHVLVKEQVEKTEAQNQKDLEALKSQQEQVAAKKVQEIKEQKDKEIKEFEKTLKSPEPAHSLDKEALKAAAAGGKAASNAVVSDGEQEGNDPLDDLETPVDPNGEPNFVVKAPNQRSQQQQQKTR